MPRVSSQKVRQVLLSQGVVIGDPADLPEKLELYDALGNPIEFRPGAPSGGDEGEVLAKASNADGDMEWVTPDVFAGEQGPAGPAGEDGPAGPAGAAGPQGPPGLTWKGVYAGGTPYVKDDVVHYAGSAWRSNGVATNVTPSETPPADTTIDKVVQVWNGWVYGIPRYIEPWSNDNSANTGTDYRYLPVTSAGKMTVTATPGATVNVHRERTGQTAYQDYVTQHGASGPAGVYDVTPGLYVILVRNGTCTVTFSDGAAYTSGPAFWTLLAKKGDTGAAGVAGLTWRGTWDPGTAYLERDAVFYNGASYRAKVATSLSLGSLNTFAPLARLAPGVALQGAIDGNEPVVRSGEQAGDLYEFTVNSTGTLSIALTPPGNTGNNSLVMDLFNSAGTLIGNRFSAFTNYTFNSTGRYYLLVRPDNATFAKPYSYSVLLTNGTAVAAPAPGTTPPDAATTVWELLAQKGSTGATGAAGSGLFDPATPLWAEEFASYSAADWDDITAGAMSAAGTLVTTTGDGHIMAHKVAKAANAILEMRARTVSTNTGAQYGFVFRAIDTANLVQAWFDTSQAHLSIVRRDNGANQTAVTTTGVPVPAAGTWRWLRCAFVGTRVVLALYDADPSAGNIRPLAVVTADMNTSAELLHTGPEVRRRIGMRLIPSVAGNIEVDHLRMYSPM